MFRSFLLIIFALTNVWCNGQQGYLVLKKHHKAIRYFWKDTHFTFRTDNGEWITGILTGIGKDSFSLTQEIIRYYLMGTDTLHYSGLSFSIAEVQALPTKNEQIEYENDQVRVILGHEKFVWVRNGFILKAAGAGYVGLNIGNDLLRRNPPFARRNLPGLGIGACVFLIGSILHRRFDPYIHPRKKYTLESVPVYRR